MTRALFKLSKLRMVGASLATLFASLAVVITAFTGTASAVTSCNGYVLCLYEHESYTGMTVRYTVVSYGACYGMVAGMNDKISAVDNNGPGLTLYQDANCAPNSSMYHIAAGDEESFQWWQYPNDRTSSFRIDPM